MNLIVGDKIFVTDENLEGILLSFSEDIVTIECPDGFEYSFPINKVFKINKEGEVENKPKPNLLVEKSKLKSKFSIPSSHPEQVQLIFNSKNVAVDLHLETLLPSTHYSYSDAEALSFQLQVVRQIIAEANRQRLRKFVLVHGVGKGRLRREIRQMLSSSYAEIEYFDGSYQKYGGGATELIIHQFD